MEIATTLFQALVLAAVASALWALIDGSWQLRPFAARVAAFTLIAWAAFSGPIPLG
jgi:hypothetical protein